MCFLFLYKRLYISTLATLVALLLATGARAANSLMPVDTVENNDSADTGNETASTALADSILAYANSYLGTCYRSGGKTPQGFDCSGFVYFIFGKFGYKTSPSSSAVKTIGKEVKRKHARPGDIIYFTGRNSKSKRPGHVGIVTEVKDGVIYFIHASVNLGISYSNTDAAYYKKRYMGIRRVLK